MFMTMAAIKMKHFFNQHELNAVQSLDKVQNTKKGEKKTAKLKLKRELR